MTRTGSFLDGKWYLPKSDRKTRNVNPADTNDVLAEFPSATAEDTHRAIDAAIKAFPAWKKTPPPERGRVLWRAAEIARRRAEEVARTMTREEGKILKEARGETTKGINVMEFFAGEGFRLEGRTTPAEARDCFTYTVRQPLGVVGLIAPWNFPWAIPCWKICPALVAGNSVVFKPAELTPATATILVEIFEEAGLPPGVLNMLVGPGSQVGEVMTHHPAVRALSFTGSTPIGMSLYEKAAKLGKKVTCEMGGKNAVIVMDDADLDKAVNAIHGGAFGSTGQRCTATSRVVAHPKVKDELLERIKDKVEKMKIGPGLDESTDMGPAVDKGQFETDLDYIEIAKKEGARCVTGGGRVEALPNGFFVKPTIFDNVDPSMRIFKEEVFGPVLTISTAQDFPQALEYANAVEFGLSGAIFTKDIDKVMRYIDEIDVGMVHVNEPTIGGEAQLPFGGMKNTGVGEREMSKEGLHFFTEMKTVFINYGGTGERLMIR